jgi:hypothetical protein
MIHRLRLASALAGAVAALATMASPAPALAASDATGVGAFLVQSNGCRTQGPGVLALKLGSKAVAGPAIFAFSGCSNNIIVSVPYATGGGRAVCVWRSPAFRLFVGFTAGEYTGSGTCFDRTGGTYPARLQLPFEAIPTGHNKYVYPVEMIIT